MYKAYDLKLSEEAFTDKFPGFSASDFRASSTLEKSSIDAAIKSLLSLNATEIRKMWFRESQIDVFLSHSRRDVTLAKMLGAYLQKTFGLDVFIDSEAWNHMDMMLSELDRQYCVSARNPDGTIKTYSYDNRNITTSHVHMILSHALTKMIDNAECFIYLNTSNSTTRQDDNSIETASPWLFYELAMVEIIEEKKPQPILENFTCDSADNRTYGPTINYSVETKRLIPLTLDEIKIWETQFLGHAKSSCANPLNYLYSSV